MSRPTDELGKVVGPGYAGPDFAIYATTDILLVVN